MKPTPSRRLPYSAMALLMVSPSWSALPAAAQTGHLESSTASSVSPPASGPGAVPAKLREIEENAEGIFDVAPNDDWPAITRYTAAIAAAWEAYRPQASADRVPIMLQNALATTLKHLQHADAAQDKIGVLRASNQLMFAAFDIFEGYIWAVPADVGRLDAGGQQVIINLLAKDPAAAGKSLTQTKEVWARLKPLVLAQRGAGVAAQYDASLLVQTGALAAKDWVRLKSSAEQGLEIVDVIEKLY